MNGQPKKRILILFTDAGGGHRSAAVTIANYLNRHYPGDFEVELCDYVRDESPWPLNKLPKIYSYVTKSSTVNRVLYELIGGGPLRAKAFLESYGPYIRKNLERLLATYQPDLIISTHFAMNGAILRQIKQRYPNLPVAVVVTDLLTASALWFDKLADLVTVPVQALAARAHSYGLQSSQLYVGGMPVAAEFFERSNQKLLRRRLGLEPDRFTILITAGGEGQGPLVSYVSYLSNHLDHIQIIVVCGRNQKLKEQLEARSWPQPILIEGYTDQMAALMHASDVLVSKAGPNTIYEALAARLPIILYSYLSGQESGNMRFVVDYQLGYYCPTKQQLIATVARLQSDPATAKQLTSHYSAYVNRHSTANIINKILQLVS